MITRDLDVIERSFAEPLTKSNDKALQLRTREALGREIGFVGSQDFSSMNYASAEDSILAEVERGVLPRDDSRHLKGAPASFRALCSTPILPPAEEIAAFRRMNYLKYRANTIRSSLDADRPNRDKLDRIDDLLRKATRIHDHIVRANVRLVISVAKKYIDTQNTFDDLFSEGIMSLLRAVDKFDVDRGFRFSTYATTAIRRQLYNYKTRDGRRRSMFNTNSEQPVLDSAFGAEKVARRETAVRTVNAVLSEMLARLDEREQIVINGRFGLDSSGEKVTFSSLGQKLNISKERARQILEQAVLKLRSIAGEFGLNDLEI
jgi:RNA polymerase sigma factor (sigma-70 family)